jgi:hypothetical protein
MDPRIEIPYALRKIMLVCAFYKLKYLSYLAIMLPKILKIFLPCARSIKPIC